MMRSSALDRPSYLGILFPKPQWVIDKNRGKLNEDFMNRVREVPFAVGDMRYGVSVEERAKIMRTAVAYVLFVGVDSVQEMECGEGRTAVRLVLRQLVRESMDHSGSAINSGWLIREIDPFIFGTRSFREEKFRENLLEFIHNPPLIDP